MATCSQWSIVTILGPLLATLLAIVFVVNRLMRRQRILEFDDEKFRVFVTGTDSGFGRELALTLDALGAVVYAGCLTDEGEQSLRRASRTNRMKTLRLDVTDARSVLDAKRFVDDDLKAAKIDGLWGLVNNAGIALGHVFPYSTMSDYRTVMEVNFFGVVRVTEAFLPLVIASRGRVVNVISILSRCTGIAEPYACSKYALQPYNDGLRRYLATFGGHVAAIEPGFFQTKLVDQTKLVSDLDRSWHELPADTRQLYGQEFHDTGHPPMANLNRTGMVVGSIVNALSSRRPKSRYVVGLDARFCYVPMGLMPDWFIDFSSRCILPFYGILSRRVRERGKSTSSSHQGIQDSTNTKKKR